MANGLDLMLGFFFILLPAGFILLLLALSSIKLVYQYQRGVKFTLGKFAGVMEPGLRIVVPVIQSWQRIDVRIMTIDIPSQEVITKDNIPVNINAVVYFRVLDPSKAVLNVRDYVYAVSKYGQTSLRNVAGEVTLDQLLAERDSIAEKLRKIVDTATDPWGIDVTALELQDIELPADLKRVMAKQAEAEREKRATIIKAEGEVVASSNLNKAAGILSKSPGALHLRTLQTLNDLSSDQSNTVIFAIPLEVLRAFEKMAGSKEKKMQL
jgi:regulator of protease activity HflC (stomatin/prohibitin superfamily)